MKTCVIDASVVAAAFFREEYADQAAALLVAGAELLAPELIYAELASVAWKRFLRHQITRDEALALRADMQAVPLKIISIHELIRPALELALTSARSVYDCLYLALAIENQCVLWTADQRLVNALAKSPVRKHLRWIGA